MRISTQLIGQVILVLVVFVSGYLGACLGLLSTPTVQASHNFADVPTGAFYHAFVDYLARSGVTAGCAPGQYCPDQAVTRGQMAVFLGQMKLLSGCPPDSVRVGTACIDRYETSVWEVSPTNHGLIQKIRLGTVTLAELQAGAIQHGVAEPDYGAGCPFTGNGCLDLYAVSISGVRPSRYITWLQAAAAARNAGKRLPTNAEWQAAALGTSDPEDLPGGQDCNTAGVGDTVPTGSRANCVSDVAAFDMVGNVFEWVADWVPASTACPGWIGDDTMCLAGATTEGGPGALIRGGDYLAGSTAGVFAVRGNNNPLTPFALVGFRAAR